MKKIHKTFISAGLTLTLALGGCGTVIPAYAAVTSTPHVVVTPKVTTTPKANPSPKGNGYGRAISPKSYNKVFGYGMKNCQKMCVKYGFAESCRKIASCPRIGNIDKSNPQMFSSTSGCFWLPWWFVVVGNDYNEEEDNGDQ